jgi:hypothetical protein
MPQFQTFFYNFGRNFRQTGPQKYRLFSVDTEYYAAK